MGVRVGALTLYPAGGPCIGVWVFCDDGAVSSSSPPAGGVGGGGGLLLSLFWCVCSALFPGAPEVFRCVSCSWLPFSGSTPC